MFIVLQILCLLHEVKAICGYSLVANLKGHGHEDFADFWSKLC